MESESRRALARSQLYSLLSRLFLPPTAEVFEGLTRGPLLAEARTAAGWVGEGVCAAVEAVATALAANRPAGLEALQSQYEATYGQAAGRDRPVYELHYGGSSDFGTPQALADLNGYYRAFLVDQSDAVQDRCDHVAVETEFAAYLAYLEAWASANGQSEQGEVAATALRGFLADHLATFSSAFAQRVQTTAAPGLYREVAGLLSAAVDAHCTQLAVARRERRYIELPELDENETQTEGAGSW